MQRFYGGSPEDWLALQPAVLNAFAEMLPELQAQESILASQIVGVGTGSLKKHDSRMLLSQWNRKASIGERLRPGKPGSQEHETALAGVGIKVITVPARSKGSPENSSE